MSSLPEHDQGASGPHQTSCPQCGFDIEWGKPCRVCGYSPPGSPAAGAASPRKKRSGGTLLALLLSAGGLLVILAVFILTNEIQKQAAGPGGQAAGSAGQASASPGQAAVQQAPQPSDAAASPQPAPADAPANTLEAGSASPAPAKVPEKAPVADTAASASTVLSDSAPGSFDVAARTDNPPFSDRDSFVDWMLKHTDQKAKYLRARWDRAQVIVGMGNISHQRVKEAFLRTPREYFCRDPRRAYENAVLPIGYGQTISGPHLVARMTDYLDPQPEQKVLEIGTGSGYQSALLSEISNHVYTIEIVDALARQTDAIYKRLEPRYPEYRNVLRKVDDGYYGWEEYAPFDRIIVTCGIDHVPPALIKQLAPNGIMVIPVGPPSGQTILRIVKKVNADRTVSLEREDIYHGKKKQIFVPFTAPGGGLHRAGDIKD